MNEKFFIEVTCQQKCHAEARVCGDVFISKRIKEEGRIIVVLSDGMGHGIKANMLGTLTAVMAVHFTREHKTIQKISEIIMNTLPVDSVKKMNYSTFTIVEIDPDTKVRILEYENPRTMVFRGSRPHEPEWNCVVLEGEKHTGREVLTATFRPQKEDRIVFCSDGVTQSGLGSDKMLTGWGAENLLNFIEESIKKEPDISAVNLASKVVNKANLNDGFHPRDDISCSVLYFREPRKLMIFTGPPVDPSNDNTVTELLKHFDGKKIICGATTADMVAREWKEEIIDSKERFDQELPPVSHMNGVELITEGILTLSKVSELLKKYTNNYTLGRGPADEIVKTIIDCDEIHFLVGTNINIAHQDPTLPMELELRRTVVHRIARTLEEKFLKEVTMKFF
ncbi:MAG: SpoIIE family protein phosphatase [Bacteroidales bacterium]|nr:SpoIIE family protein phosphatase [Bacteroidales bacterium]HNW72814.1 SpoIIE family protein phosphatase [Bacteroidales bacterium]HPS50012.1 SpoIIE family protein phosphatase [Bacteroidales bacterium]